MSSADNQRPATTQTGVTPSPVLEVAVPTPMRDLLSYSAPAGTMPARGTRVSVPLGRRYVTGIVVNHAQESRFPGALKAARASLDPAPMLSNDILSLALWAAAYYHHPVGDAVLSALPVALRHGDSVTLTQATVWRPVHPSQAQSHDPMAALRRAPRQAEQLALLQSLVAEMPHGCPDHELPAFGLQRAALRQLQAKGLVDERPEADPPHISADASPPTLNAEQRAAVERIHAARASYRSLLLYGVTGSGKTEVYLQALAPAIAAGGQALVLVPEIGLTPQTLSRFKTRFPRTAVSHSAMTDRQRAEVFLRCQAGMVDILIGTRSAIFTPLPRLALIVVDEEHDPSFKQQDGFRYSGRDLAVKRALDAKIPVVLGSATPSFESLQNARSGRYERLLLRTRPTGAAIARIHLEDLRRQKVEEGLSQRLLLHINKHLANGGQVLLFLNRRGYAPSLSCQQCGWLAECAHCDARLTLHRSPARLMCHHCDAHRSVPQNCPECQSDELHAVGVGTQRIAQLLAERFAGTPVLRIDADSARSKRQFERDLETIHRGEPAVLIGTQMLAKGHHFPSVTLAAIINADAGLFSTDFRAPERTAQVILQVAGRSGRAERPGEVWLQTHHPHHPVITTLVEEGYDGFADDALNERESAALPPFAVLALVRADAPNAEVAQRFLTSMRDYATTQVRAPLQHTGSARQRGHQQRALQVSIAGPAPAPMERRAGRYRYQLLLRAKDRAPLHQLLGTVVTHAEAHPRSGDLRWSIDVDPLDTF